MKSYMIELANNIQILPPDSQDRRGMLVIEQLAGEIFPHLSNDELELNETIVVEINKEIGISSLIESSLLQ